MSLYNKLIEKENDLHRRIALLETQLSALESGHEQPHVGVLSADDVKASIIDVKFLLKVIDWAREVFFDKDGEFRFPSRFAAIFNWKFIKLLGEIILMWLK